MKDLEKKQANKADDENGVEFISKDGQGEQAFCDGVPYPLVHAFSLNQTQRTEEDLLKDLASDQRQEDSKVPQNLRQQ